MHVCMFSYRDADFLPLYNLIIKRTNFPCIQYLTIQGGWFFEDSLEGYLIYSSIWEFIAYIHNPTFTFWVLLAHDIS